MTLLATWLEREMGERELSLRNVESATGVSISTLSAILRKGHVPKPATLLRIADHFGATHEQILALAAGIPYKQPSVDLPEGAEDGFLVQEILTAFRQIPDAWKADALAQLQLFVRLSQRPPMRIIGGEEESNGK